MAFQDSVIDAVEVAAGEGDPDAGGLQQLAQFRGGERRVLGTAPSDQPDVLDLGLPQGGQYRVGHVGCAERGWLLQQDPGHVDGDIADADHDGVPHAGHRLRFGVRVPGVPGDELAGRTAAGQVLAGNAEVSVIGSADRVDHRVVGGDQFGGCDVPAELDKAEEAHPVGLEHPGQRGCDGLDAGVVGSDAVAQQPERGRQPIEDVHQHTGVGDEGCRCVQAGRPGTDDRDPSWLICRHALNVVGRRDRSHATFRARNSTTRRNRGETAPADAVRPGWVVPELQQSANRAVSALHQAQGPVSQTVVTIGWRWPPTWTTSAPSTESWLA